MREFVLFLAFLACALPALAASNLKSIEETPHESTGPLLEPGMAFQLPNGVSGVVKAALANGNLGTSLNIELSPAGQILTGPFQGEMVKTPYQEDQTKTARADQEMPRQDMAHDQENAKTEPLPGGFDIAELLPATSSLPEAEAEPAPRLTKTPAGTSASKTRSPQNPSQQAGAPKPQPDQGPSKKEHHKKEDTSAKKNPTTPASDPGPRKVRPGQEMRIPPEAIPTGNLDFLEGCWQGTRPEYYSKRTIRECFCFGKNGKNGKRRVIDPIGRRRCIGSSSAILDAHGVLSVKSSGAVCDDGERWGQAEMTCRNSGPRTPCSWIFRDAQNGHQSYQIPFIRVESCGR